jgi:uncharacterized protein (DUF58 family)
MAALPEGAREEARRSLAEAKGLGDALPDLLVQAKRVATTILAGWHGRRRSGPGETFWQFRPFVPGEPTAGIDWRRSARDDHIYIREKEWEAAHTVWMSTDLSASMQFRSRLGQVSKRDRAVILTLALADLLCGAGERVGLLGLTPLMLSRNGAERMAEALACAKDAPIATDAKQLRRFTDVLLFSDFLDPMPELEGRLSAIAGTGARAHLVQIVDPIEETFPYAGRTEFRDPETGLRHIVGRAEQYRADYQARLASHRDRLAVLCRRLSWTFLIHRTDRPATEPLLALHARLTDRGDMPGAGQAIPRGVAA